MKKLWIILGSIFGLIILIVGLYFLEESYTDVVLHGGLTIDATVKEKFVDISDKIAAMIGEEKLAKMKKTKEFTERALKKIFSVLGFVSESQEEEECQLHLQCLHEA